MGKKKYIFFDIDGTLLAGGYAGYIPESTKLALRKLKAAGHFTAIATGRAHWMARKYMQELGFVNMVSDGGYGLTIDNRLLGIDPLPREGVLALLRECEEKGFAWGIQVEDSDTRLVPDERFYQLTGDGYLKNNIVPGLDPEQYENIYKAYVVCTEEEEAQLENLKRVPWCRYMPEYFFVEPLEKDRGIRKVMDYYGADCSDVIVFGDGDNDLSMFTKDWTCVAMGNATPRLKAKADFITTDVDHDGVYNACLQLGLFEGAL